MTHSKFYVRCVLHEKPMHGYEVVQAVERSTKGCCSPTEGTVYPMLNEFEAGGYVTAHGETVQGRERKVYTLTERGRERSEEHTSELQSLMRISSAVFCLTTQKKQPPMKNPTRHNTIATINTIKK